MRPAEKIKRLIKNVSIDTSRKVNQKVLTDLFAEFDKSKKTDSAIPKPNLWRIIMKTKIIKLAAAAVIILAVVFSLTFFDKSIPSAYAIEQTIEAYQGTSYLHFYYYPCTVKKTGKEAWIQYDENGNVDNLRVNLYNREGENKHLEEVWSEGITFFWRSHENTLEIDENGDYTPVMLDFVKSNDPKQAIETVYKYQKEGRCQIEIQEGSSNNEPIKITARYLPGKYSTHRNMPAIHDVFIVDPKTKLVTRREVYKVLEDRIELHGVYKDYDSQPFDPNIFNIEKEIPADAVQVVHYNVKDVNNVGIEPGSHAIDEAAYMLVNEFFNALIAKDYNKAGLLFGGMPIDEVEERFGQLNIVRLVSIGDKVKSGDGFPSHYPCVVEIEKDSKIIQWQPKIKTGKVTPYNINRWRIKAVF